MNVATMSARIAQRGIARSLSAFRACHWRERRSQKSLSRSGRCRRSRRRCAARGEAGSVALVCAESARARPPRNNALKRTRVSTRSAVPSWWSLRSAATRCPLTRLVAFVFFVVVVVPFRRDTRSLAYRIFRESGRYERRRAYDVVPRIPTRRVDLPVDTVQFNAAILRAHRTLFRSFFFARVSICSLAPVIPVNTWRRRWGTREQISP